MPTADMVGETSDKISSTRRNSPKSENVMDTNMVSPMPEIAPMADFDKSPPSPMDLSPPAPAPIDDLPPPPLNTFSAGQSPKKQKNYETDDWGCGNWCEYMIVITLASVLLVGALTLVLFWVLYYRGGFAWRENPKKQFNLHPVLMVAGYIFFSGFSILLYRICRCCRKIYVKLFHALFHALAIPCIGLGFLAVWDFHNLVQPPIPNFYSLHSWLGLVTSGLFALQFVVGFFSFLILLCCEGATAAFRAALVPIHSSFGIVTFMLAVATCLTGLTQKALVTFGPDFTRLVPEVIVVNTLAAVLAASAIVICYSVMREDLKSRDHHLISMNSDLDTYQNWLEEGIIVNAMGMVFVALGILLSYLVRRDYLRYKSDYFDTERL